MGAIVVLRLSRLQCLWCLKLRARPQLLDSPSQVLAESQHGGMRLNT